MSQFITRTILPLLLVALATGSAVAQSSAAIRENIWVTNGTVVAMASRNSTIYIGGSFSSVGIATGPAVLMSEGTGQVIPPFPRFGNQSDLVQAVAPDGNGGWYIGGTFAEIGGAARANLAQVDANGNLTAWDPSPGGTVLSVARGGDLVYIAGNFTTVGGQPRSYVAAVDAASGALTGWNANVNALVLDVEVGGDRVYLAGVFNQAGGQLRAGVAAVDPITGACLSWVSSASGSTIAVQEGNVYVGGNALSIVSGTSGELLAAPIFTNASINDIAVDPANGEVFFCGTFTTAGGMPRGRLASVDAGGNVTTWNPNADQTVHALAFGAGGVIACGEFGYIGGQPRSRAASISKATGNPTNWDPSLDDQVNAVAVSGPRVALGGYFRSANNVTRSHAAAIDASTGAALPWDPNADGAVQAIVATSSAVYLGGTFRRVGGASRSYLAAVDPLTGAPTGWVPNVTAQFGEVLTMRLDGSTLYVGGNFQTMGGIARRFLAAVDASTGAILPWNPDPNHIVETMWLVVPILAVPPTLYIGGWFTTVGGIARNRLAAINGSTGAPTSWNPNANDVVYRVLALTNQFGNVTRVYVAGKFTVLGGITRNRVAAIDDIGVPTPWNPNANGTAHAIQPLGGIVYIGGAFTSIGGQARTLLAGIDATTGAATNFNAEVQAYSPGFDFVGSMLRSNSTLYVGGSYQGIAGCLHRNFAGILDGTVTAVEGVGAPVVPQRMSAAPNPFVRSTSAEFWLTRKQPTEIALFNVAGRLVRDLYRGILEEGPQHISWDGLDDLGRPAPSGVYFLRVCTPSAILRTKLYRLR